MYLIGLGLMRITGMASTTIQNATAVPFTPATGPRILIKKGADRRAITALLLTVLKEELWDESRAGTYYFQTRAPEIFKRATRGSNELASNFTGSIKDFNASMIILPHSTQSDEKKPEESDGVLLNKVSL